VIKWTTDQKAARSLLSSDSRHIELMGGSRSGKTAVLIDAILTRALSAKLSRHLITRFRANSLQSIFGPTGTLWWVLDNNYPPEVRERSKWYVSDNLLILPNKSELWAGGLDDPKRVDKLLGNEYVDILVNEASQVPYGSFTTILTRLAQVVKRDDGEGNLRQKCYVDDNPPPESHWLPILFQKKRDPISKRPLIDPFAYATMLMNPDGNKENLDPAYLEALQQLPERQRKRFWEGKNGDAGEAALWTSELLDQQRVLDGSKIPKMVRTIVIIDPSGADNIDDAASDEIGIGVMSLGEDKVATDAYDRHDADCIVGESNFGGAMVRHVVQTAKPGVPYREVTATKGKHLRAEPVAALYEVDKVRLIGRFPDLEDEMLSMTTVGYTGTKSPNRLDWMVWGVTELFPKIISQARRDEDAKSLSRPVVPVVNVGRSRWKRFGGGRR
jgi:hypothetical protein